MTNLVKNSDKEKYVYDSYGIAFIGKGEWSFGNGFTRNAIILGVDNISSSHAENLKNNLVFGEENTFGFNRSFCAPEKKFNFSKANRKFCLSFYDNAENISIICFLMKTIFKFKADNKNVNFPSQFCLGSISNGFSATESREVSLNGIVYAFSVDYNSLNKSEILNIHNYLMIKNNINKCLTWLTLIWAGGEGGILLVFP